MGSIPGVLQSGRPTIGCNLSDPKRAQTPKRCFQLGPTSEKFWQLFALKQNLWVKYNLLTIVCIKHQSTLPKRKLLIQMWIAWKLYSNTRLISQQLALNLTSSYCMRSKHFSKRGFCRRVLSRSLGFPPKSRVERLRCINPGKDRRIRERTSVINNCWKWDIFNLLQSRPQLAFLTVWLSCVASDQNHLLDYKLIKM